MSKGAEVTSPADKEKLTLKAPRRKTTPYTGLVIRASSITSIDRADNNLVTIIVDGPIGCINDVQARMTMGKDGIRTEIGDTVVITTDKKAVSAPAFKKAKGTSLNIFM